MSFEQPWRIGMCIWHFAMAWMMDDGCDEVLVGIKVDLDKLR